MPQAFTPSQHPEWVLLRPDFALHAPDAMAWAHQLPAESGVYLWTFVTGATESAIYIGKAMSLSRRIYNYAQPFQPHSPNDRKLYFAQSALRSTTPRASFPLYWKPVPSAALNETERNAITALRPALNDRSRYSQEHRTGLEAAYSALYKEVIARHFGEA